MPAELAYLEHCFELNDDGSAKFPELVYSAPKKSGKSTFGAILVLVIVLLFGGHDAEATIAANDQDQAASRVFAMIGKIIKASPALCDHATIYSTEIIFDTGAKIEAISHDAASAAGGNQNVSCFDELWGFVGERSQRFWDELTPLPTRRAAWRLTVTYSGFTGESKLLEKLYKRGIAAPEIAPDLHATSDGLLMFWSTTPVAPWQTPRWIEQQRATMRPVAFARIILNQWVTSENPFIEMQWWDDCVDDGLRPVLSDKSVNIWVGVDASVKRDSTAIVAVTVDSSSSVRLIWHRVFQPSADNPIDFEQQIEATILDLQRRFNMVAVLYDPYQMQASAQRLTRAGVPMHEYAQTMANITAASTNLFEIVKHRNLVLYPDDDMRLAASRAIASEGSRGWKITKEKTSHKIDTIVALGMACHGAMHGIANNNADGWLEYMRRQCEAQGIAVQPQPSFGYSFSAEEIIQAERDRQNGRPGGGFVR